MWVIDKSTGCLLPRTYGHAVNACAQKADSVQSFEQIYRGTLDEHVDDLHLNTMKLPELACSKRFVTVSRSLSRK